MTSLSDTSVKPVSQGPRHSHFGRARQNGSPKPSWKEMIIHLAFYAGWPRAMSPITLARELFPGGGDQ